MRLLAIQVACNAEANGSGRQEVGLLNAEEQAPICELIAAGTWPRKRTGNDPTSRAPLAAVFSDRSSQLPLIGADL